MKALLYFATVLLSFQAHAAANPVEVGEVEWGRDYEQALEKAKESGKPIFLLFQEVPGCAGCKQFGQDVLSDAVVVETIETKFVPLLIHNNKGGEDARIRKKYGEPAWNYQVVRFLDADGRDIIPRKDRVWSGPALMSRIQMALDKYKPTNCATNGASAARVALCQFCFWTGELKLGAIPGVLQTEAGFIKGREVTLVTYDPKRLSLDDLIGRAADAGVASSVYLDDPSLFPGAEKIEGYRRAPESDQKRQLKGTMFSQLDLSAEQATKVNAYARTNPQKALEFLTPSQIVELRNTIAEKP